MAESGAALHLATSMMMSTNIEINLILATISLCSGAINVSSLKSGGGIIKAGMGAVFSLPMELIRAKPEKESEKIKVN